MLIEEVNLYVCTSSKELREVRPGTVIDFDGNIIFKTEYMEQDKEGNPVPLCYNEAGESWHGDFSTRVYPIEISL